MSLDFINLCYPADKYFQIEELITSFVAVSESRAIADSDILLLHALLLPFKSPEWIEKASATIEEILESPKADPDNVPYYIDALKELSAHVCRLKAAEAAENHQTILTLFYSAYHLAFYEYTDVKLTEPGWLFKACLADNVDPTTRGQGSYLGYLKRLQNYVGAQLAVHKDTIRQKLFAVQASPVFTDPDVAQLLQPSAAPIVPMSENHGIASVTSVIDCVPVAEALSECSVSKKLA